jgi:ketosteroid isomerase-like protein
MKKVLLTVLLLQLMGLLANGQAKTKLSRDTETEQTLMQLERDWSQAYITHDTAIAARIIADDVGIDGRGIVTTKAQEIDDVRGPAPGTPPPPVLTLAESVVDMKVRVYGEVAVVNGRVLEQVRTKTKDAEIQYRRTTVWIKRQGRWQCVSFHGSRILEPPK